MVLNKKAMIVQGIIALLVGVGTGALTVFGQKYLPGSFNSLANSGAIWLVPAFFVALAAQTKGWAIVLCMETLILCVISYYWMEAILNQHSFLPVGYYFYVWLSCAVVFGVVFGLGAFLRRQRSSNHPWGASLLPAAFLSEGLSELLHLSDYLHMIPAVIGRIFIGLMLYILIYKGEFLKGKPLLSFSALSALGLAGYEVLLRVTSV
jgi:hypothetical protein